MTTVYNRYNASTGTYMSIPEPGDGQRRERPLLQTGARSVSRRAKSRSTAARLRGGRHRIMYIGRRRGSAQKPRRGRRDTAVAASCRGLSAFCPGSAAALTAA